MYICVMKKVHTYKFALFLYIRNEDYFERTLELTSENFMPSVMPVNEQIFESSEV